MQSSVVKSRDLQSPVRIGLAGSAGEETLVTKRNAVSAVERLDIGRHGRGLIRDHGDGTSLVTGLTAVESAVSIFYK